MVHDRRPALDRLSGLASDDFIDHHHLLNRPSWSRKLEVARNCRSENAEHLGQIVLHDALQPSYRGLSGPNAPDACTSLECFNLKT